MTKTIKVVDLLNKIANGEEVPEKIKYNGTEYNLNEITGWYQSIDVIGNVNEWFISKYRLNDTVEIIEEQQDIDKIKTLNPEEVYFKDGTELVYKLMYDKINEIAMRVNKMSKNIKDKE